MMTRRAADQSEAVEKCAATIGALLRKVVTVLIWTMATIMAVKELGFDVAPLLAGAGVAGLAIGVRRPEPGARRREWSFHPVGEPNPGQRRGGHKWYRRLGGAG